ncbi:MAG: phytanoyl-CoA dioxygenase family protein [Acidimicrobiales bacterium]|nr:phytanoyl-CoA dioxygenase family protein [Acidimicrobiales bacterium]
MLTHLPPTATGAEIAEVLRRDGGVIVDDLADEAQLDAFFDEMQPFVDATPVGPDAFTGVTTRRTGGLLARSVTSREFVMHPTVLATCDDFLGHVTSYQLHLTQIIDIGPGAAEQQIHRDQWAFDFFPFPSGYEVQCNTIWAGDDFTEANGATRIVVGSSRREDGLRFGIEDTVPAEMTRGSVLFYSGSVYHGGGPNTTDAHRRAINITYNVSFLRQEENQYLSVPQPVAATFPEELQRLMGYRMGAYALGYIDDLRDPITVLERAPRPGA